MTNILSYLCCCCPCLKKNNKPKKRKTKKGLEKIRKTVNTVEWETMSKLTPSQIEEKNLTKIYKIPEQWPTLTDCLKAEGLEVHFQQQLGKGGYGEVFKARDFNSGTDIACKRLQLTEKREERFIDLRNELFILTKGKKHENIIQIFKHFIVIDDNTSQENCYIFMEFANGGTLFDKIKDRNSRKTKPLDESRAKFYFRQICNGLAFLHRMGIAHKDLKPSNVLIVVNPDLTEVVKITDFGISRIRFDERKKIIVKELLGAGTPEFMSPQILKIFIYEQFGRKVDTLRQYDPFKADTWALGVCLYIMICAELPFHMGGDTFESFEQIYKAMKSNKFHISDKTKLTYSPDCLDLIQQLIESDVSRRLSIYYVLEHGWLIK